MPCAAFAPPPPAPPTPAPPSPRGPQPFHAPPPPRTSELAGGPAGVRPPERSPARRRQLRHRRTQRLSPGRRRLAPCPRAAGQAPADAVTPRDAAGQVVPPAPALPLPPAAAAAAAAHATAAAAAASGQRWRWLHAPRPAPRLRPLPCPSGQRLPPRALMLSTELQQPHATPCRPPPPPPAHAIHRFAADPARWGPVLSLLLRQHGHGLPPGVLSALLSTLTTQLAAALPG